MISFVSSSFRQSGSGVVNTKLPSQYFGHHEVATWHTHNGEANFLDAAALRVDSDRQRGMQFGMRCVAP